MSARLGLVTVLFNSPEVLPGFFESLERQVGCDFALWVVDNSGDDRAIRVARDQCAQRGLAHVTFIKNTANVGVAAANNQGIRAALASGCTHVALLNNDIEFSNPDFLAGMLREAVSGGEHAVVPKMLYHDSGRIWYAGGIIQAWRGINVHVGDGQEDCAEFDVSHYTQYAPTCFLLLSGEVFSRVGQMDERYFVYYDDTDFVWRMNQAGFRIRYDPRFVLTHKVSSSTGGALTPFSVYYLTRNKLLFILKNIGLPLRAVALLVFVVTFCKQWLTYDHSLRASLRKGWRDGFMFLWTARAG